MSDAAFVASENEEVRGPACTPTGYLQQNTNQGKESVLFKYDIKEKKILF